MKLKTLRIQNLRCCKDVSIELDSMHALVGANNAGKSTILKALDFLFNPSTSKVSDEAFWKKDTTLEIRVEARFVDLTDSEKEALRSCLLADDSFHFARTAATKIDEEADADTDGKISISQQYESLSPKYPWLVESSINAKAIETWLKSPAELVVNGRSFHQFLSGAKAVGAWKEKAASFVSSYLRHGDFESQWIDNPKGFPNVLKANLPHFELIPAVRDVADESKVLKTNPFGRLIHEIVRTFEDDLKREISEKLKETTRRLNREGQAERLATIVEVEESMKEFLSDVMPADLEIEFQSPSIETLLTTPRIYVDDGFKGSIEGKGHGLQRAVIFSILRSYAKLITTKKEQGKRTLILGVEEPELYMHPTAQRTIRRVLRTIADNGDQVIFSTHSPLLVDVAYFDEIVRVESGTKEGDRGAKVFQLTMQAMIDDIETRHPSRKGQVSAGAMRERYGHAYTPTRNEGFFAKQVILVEGQTESYCLPIYARALGHEFDTLGLAVIDCGGKNQIDRLYRIFNELGIACYVVFDYDKNNSDAVDASVQLLKFLNQCPDPPTEVQILDTHTCFVETWEKDLHPEIADIDQLLISASQYLGRCGKPLQARYVATHLTKTDPPTVPATLKSIIAQAVNTKRAASCLKCGVDTHTVTS